ncbi:MAG: AAA family ATPase [Nitrospirae bacterium]|nr:AAA family ATPase [Nitrospirota bacterium]
MVKSKKIFYISRIKLTDIRCFKTLDINVSNPNSRPSDGILIIGKNGTCKSTLLRAIVIGLNDKADGNALLAEDIGQLISVNANDAKIEIELRSTIDDEKPIITTEIVAESGKEVIIKQEAKGITLPDDRIFLCGYGVGRSSTSGSESGRSYRIIDSAYTLFEYQHVLIDTELTLRRLQDYLGNKLYAYTIRGIKKALGLSPRDKIDIQKGGGVIISGPSVGGKSIPLKGWADGYRITLTWLLDLYAWAMRSNNVTKSGGIRGILLVDELEQHLHPSMQAPLLPHLTNLFPDLQIIATSHSPLVALCSSQRDLIVLHKKGKYVEAEENIPDFTGYSAEDMLVDDRLFDTSAYSPKISKKLQVYQKLVKIPQNQRSDTQKKMLKAIAQELISQQLPEVRESSISKSLRELEKICKKYDL